MNGRTCRHQRWIAPLLLGIAMTAPLAAQRGIDSPRALATPAIKSEHTAFWLSLGATIGPVALSSMAGYPTRPALFVAGLMVGPAMGHFYAGEPRRAITGIAVRSAAAVLIGAMVAGDSDCGDFICVPAGAVLLGTAVLISDVMDIGAASTSARKYNEAHAAPVILPLPDGTNTRLGVGVRFAF
jgi:hypothetical protein